MTTVKAAGRAAEARLAPLLAKAYQVFASPTPPLPLLVLLEMWQRAGLDVTAAVCEVWAGHADAVPAIHLCHHAEPSPPDETHLGEIIAGLARGGLGITSELLAW